MDVKDYGGEVKEEVGREKMVGKKLNKEKRKLIGI